MEWNSFSARNEIVTANYFVDQGIDEPTLHRII